MARIIIDIDDLTSLKEMYAIMDKINAIVKQDHKSSVKGIHFEL